MSKYNLIYECSIDGGFDYNGHGWKAIIYYEDFRHIILHDSLSELKKVVKAFLLKKGLENA